MTNKVVDIVIGMFAGSEAKGKLISILADKYDGALVRTGSVNAAHTVYYNGKSYAWHQLPAGSMHAPKDCMLVLGAGAQIDMTYFTREIGWLLDAGMLLKSDDSSRIAIDPNASIIDGFDKFAENGYSEVCGPQWYNPTTCEFHNGLSGANGGPKERGTCEGCELYPKDSLHRTLGSTTHGSGMNLMRKLDRGGGMIRDPQGNKSPPLKLAKDVPELAGYIADTVLLLNQLVDEGKRIMLEGTQGSVLSMHHGTYPKCTSRDTNAGAWLSETGLSPSVVDKVYGVARTFPIRVAGNSGPMSSEELSWQDVSLCAGVPYEHNDDPSKIKGLIEITTATKRVRRVFAFADKDFAKSLAINRPAEMMLTFIDYLNISDAGKTQWNDLSQKSKDWVLAVEKEHHCYFRYLSTGAKQECTIDRGEIAP